MTAEKPKDLDFHYRIDKNGVVTISHNGRFAAKLRGKAAADFAAKMARLPFPEQQQWLARITGNYKRGNERQAKNHPKNK